MFRVFFLTFGVLGWAWYEMSGGSSFVPGEHGVKLLAAAPVVQNDVVARDTPAADLNAIIQPAVVQPVLLRNGPAVVTPAVMRADLVVDGDKLAMLATPAVLSDAMPAEEAGETPSMDQVIADAATVDYRHVTGQRVNLRGGPSTSYDVVTQLLLGEEVEILDDAGDGWVKLRALDGNDIGWMADSFLSASN